MIKNYTQFINEDIRGKNITLDISYINLTRLYPGIQVYYNDGYKIVISSNTELYLNKEFYDMLKKDNINKDDIVFENCEEIELFNVDGFTKISDYGEFSESIKDFSCSRCKNLTSLEGAPEMISGDFYCSRCTSLTSLEGAPETVSGNFGCSGCGNLTSLKGAPKKVGGYFDCQDCKNLNSLEGAPEEVGGKFYCSWSSDAFIKLAKAKYGQKCQGYK